MINVRIRQELARSLRYIGEFIHDSHVFDMPRLQRVCDGLHKGEKYPPWVFARYYALVQAIDENNILEIQTSLDDILSSDALTEIDDFVSVGNTLNDRYSKCYLDLLNDDESINLEFSSPTSEQVDEFIVSLNAALDLLRHGAPPLHGEISALVDQFVFLSQPDDAIVSFDGGTHFQLWGALFLNVARPRSVLQLAEVLSHESAHNLLFGLCIDEALTLNDDAERFTSPLREDPRPMDGIFHATFVAARMHWTLSALTSSGLLSPGQCSAAKVASLANVERFKASRAIVGAHGRLTDLGRAVIESADLYMASA